MALAVSFFEVLVSFTALLLAIFYFRNRPDKRLPPGPRALPILGNVLQMEKKSFLTLTKWAKKYGPVYKFKMGNQDTIVVSDHKLLKELFSDIASSGRSLNPVILEFSKGPYGVVNGEGESWETQRRFTLRKLRDVGFAKTSMESMIMEEVRAMTEWFTERQGKPISGNRIFNAPVMNSLYHIVTGERCEWERGTKPEIHLLCDSFLHGIQTMTSNGVMFAPSLRLIAPELLGWNKFVKTCDTMSKTFASVINNHQKNLDPANPRDFIDHALNESNSTTDPNSSFYKETGHKNLVAGVFDLFLAGSETTSTTMSWLMMYMSGHQKYQEKLRTEINKVIGQTRLPTLADRQNMPFTEAVIAETLRLSNVLPLGVPHRMMADLEFHGYLLPKGAVLFGNAYAILHDPEIWEDPLSFRVERFLSDDGTKFMKHEALVPFSVGKRQCLGESLAKDSLFLFTTGIFQRFKVLPDPEKTNGLDYEPSDGFLMIPKPFQILLDPI